MPVIRLDKISFTGSFCRSSGCIAGESRVDGCLGGMTFFDGCVVTKSYSKATWVIPGSSKYDVTSRRLRVS